MHSWQAGDVHANGLRLHYTRTGGDKPPVVLAHGVTDDGLCWSPVASDLERDYDVIMVDARGHGRSEAPERDYDPGTQAADLAGLIAALGLTKPALLGHSMGAATSLVLAGTYPDVPGAILLEDPPGWWIEGVQPGFTEERRTQMRERFHEQKRQTRDELLAAERLEHPNWSDAELEPWADAKVRYSPYVLDVLKEGNPRRVDWPATMRRITCPALLIIADQELGGIVDADTGEALRQMVPHMHMAHVPAAGHSIRRDQFEEYMGVVRGFLGEWAANWTDDASGAVGAKAATRA